MIPAIAIGALLSIVAPVAAASPLAADQMTTMWMVQPVDPSSEPLTVQRGQPILEQKLLPTGLAVLDAAFDGGEIKRPLASSSQLFEVLHRSASVYCAFQYKGPDGLAAILVSPTATGTQLCFVDAERDGRFESYFAAGNATPSLPGIYGPLPKKLRAIQEPLAYHPVDPASFSGALSVSIVYTGKGLVNNVRRYAVSFGSKDRRESLTATTVSHGKDFPLTVDVMGARISVLSGSAQTIVARVERPIPPQPFAVVRTVTTFYY